MRCILLKSLSRVKSKYAYLWIKGFGDQQLEIGSGIGIADRAILVSYLSYLCHSQLIDRFMTQVSYFSYIEFFSSWTENMTFGVRKGECQVKT